MIRRKMHLVFKRFLSAPRNGGDRINVTRNGYMDLLPQISDSLCLKRFEKRAHWECLKCKLLLEVINSKLIFITIYDRSRFICRLWQNL